jgi:hypothetical protein
MPKFRISYQTEDWWDLTVEADNIDDVVDNFWSGKYNHSDAKIVDSGYIQDSIDIQEI